MTVICRNFIFTTETLEQIGFQNIMSYWQFVKRFGMIFSLKVEKCVKILTKNREFTNLDDTPTSWGSQWGLVVLPMFWPYMYTLQPCATNILVLLSVRLRPPFFQKNEKNRYDAVPYVLVTSVREKLAFFKHLVSFADT